MKLKYIICVIALLLPFFAIGKSHRSKDFPRLTFGGEWSYTATLYNATKLYYIDNEAGRIDDAKQTFKYITDGEVYAHVGYNINNRWNLSMYMGYIGIGDFHPGLSLSVRATRYFGTNPSLDRWFAYCDAGSGISIKSQPQEILTAKVGGGYRVSLSKFTKLDLIASFRFVYTHPDIYVGQQRIEKQFIGRNEGFIASLSVGLGVTF